MGSSYIWPTLPNIGQNCQAFGQDCLIFGRDCLLWALGLVLPHFRYTYLKSQGPWALEPFPLKTSLLGDSLAFSPFLVPFSSLGLLPEIPLRLYILFPEILLDISVVYDFKIARMHAHWALMYNRHMTPLIWVGSRP